MLQADGLAELKSIQGIGLSVRTPYYDDLLAVDASDINNPASTIGWLELLVDNWLAQGGLDLSILHALSERYPCVLHGVNLSLGSTRALNLQYLQRIRQIKQLTQARWYSEHCSFSSDSTFQSPDLFPMPYTLAAKQLLVDHIQQVQDCMGEQMLIENISYYVHNQPEAEAEFFAEVVQAADCGILLDVNNLYVNSQNFGYDAQQFINCLPLDRIRQIHLAGHSVETDAAGQQLLVDTHSGPVCEAVLQLYQYLLQRTGPVPTNLEWDMHLPTWAVIHNELHTIKTHSLMST